MKNIILALLILLGTLSIQAQDAQTETPTTQQATTLRLSLFNPTFGFEQKLSETSSLSGKIGLGIGFSAYISNQGSGATIAFTPFASIEPRFYVGIAKREAAGQRIDHFSGTYVGFPITKFLAGPGISAGPVFGFQKTLKKNGFFNISMGLGYFQADNYSTFGWMGDLGLGFILN